MSYKKLVGSSVSIHTDNPQEFERAMRKFKRKTKESGIIDDIKNRRYYESKGKKAHKARKAAKRRHARELNKLNELQHQKRR